MPKNSSESKTRLSALAQLIACLAQHEGLTKTSDLVARTGFSERQIWRAKSSLKPDAYVTDKDVTLTNTSVSKMSENLTKVSVTQKEKSPPHPPLKKNLAAAAASDVLIWLKDNFSITEPEASEWLTEQIDLYGEGKVRAGWEDYKRKLAGNQVQTHSIATLRGFISSATPAAEKPQTELDAVLQSLRDEFAQEAASA